MLFAELSAVLDGMDEACHAAWQRDRITADGYVDAVEELDYLYDEWSGTHDLPLDAEC